MLQNPSLMRSNALGGRAFLSACLVVIGLFPLSALADRNESGRRPPGMQTRSPTKEEFREHIEQMSWCSYPIANAAKAQGARAAREQTLELEEIEPNDLIDQAQIIALSSEIGNEIDFAVTGSISPGNDEDYYRINAQKGDIIGVSVISLDVEEFLYRFNFSFFFSFFGIEVPVGVLDPMVGIYDSAGLIFYENDDEFFASSFYPEDSPLPGGELSTDSFLSFVVPEDGDYLLRVSSFATASSGPYLMNVIMRRPPIEADAIGDTQVIYVDLNGVGFINIHAIWDEGWYQTSISPLSDWLSSWGLTRQDEAAVVQAIMDVVEENFDDLRRAELNGDRDTQLIDGQYDIEIRNSRDHPDPWGEPNVSRVIVGGSIEELGIVTIGRAQSIDPGNFDREETAVVLLDLLSEPEMIPVLCWDDRGNDDPSDDRQVPCCVDPETGGAVPCCIVTEDEACDDPADPVVPILRPSLATINGIPLAPGVSIIDAIGAVVGNIVTHEAGHYLGLWHTDNSNEQLCLIDSATFPIAIIAGAGPDGIFGNADDVDIDFVPDEFTPAEGIGIGIEEVPVRVAHGCSTGKTAGGPIDPELPPVATASVRAMPSAGAAPLMVSFAGGGVDPDGDPFVTFNWSFGDGTNGSGANVDHIYTTPGTYLAVLTSISSGGESSTATVRIEVLDVPNEPPAVVVSATPSTGEAPLVVVFEGVARDPDGVVVAYLWDFGDGETGSGQLVEHVFIDPGAYGVLLTAIDDMGGRGIATTIIRTSSPSGSTAADIVTPNGNALEMPLPSAGGLGIPACGAGVASGFVMSLLGLMLLRRRY